MPRTPGRRGTRLDVEVVMHVSRPPDPAPRRSRSSAKMTDRRPVRVDERTAVGGREHGLDDRDHRRDAAAAGERHDRRRRSRGAEQPAGRMTSIGVPACEGVVHPVRHPPPRHPLDRRGEVGVGPASSTSSSSAGPPRRRSWPGTCRTARPVGERLLEVGGDVEHERPGLGRLVDDLLHGEEVEPVVVLSHAASRPACRRRAFGPPRSVGRALRVSSPTPQSAAERRRRWCPSRMNCASRVAT